jgi:hypothetical protein
MTLTRQTTEYTRRHTKRFACCGRPWNLALAMSAGLQFPIQPRSRSPLVCWFRPPSNKASRDSGIQPARASSRLEEAKMPPTSRLGLGGRTQHGKRTRWHTTYYIVQRGIDTELQEGKGKRCSFIHGKGPPPRDEIGPRNGRRRDGGGGHGMPPKQQQQRLG